MPGRRSACRSMDQLSVSATSAARTTADRGGDVSYPGAAETDPLPAPPQWAQDLLRRFTGDLKAIAHRLSNVCVTESGVPAESIESAPDALASIARSLRLLAGCGVLAAGQWSEVEG